MTLFFFKAICDEQRDLAQLSLKAHPDNLPLRVALMQHARFAVPIEARFDVLCEGLHERGIGARIDRALYYLAAANDEKLNGLLHDLRFTSGELGQRSQSDRILRDVLAHFASDALDLRPSRLRDPAVIGKVFSATLQKFALVSQPSADQYPTPPLVAALMARLLAPQPGEAICDPVCGSGGLLIACADLITPKHDRHCFALYGQDADCSSWAATRMHLLLHRLDNHRVAWGDTLRDPQLLDRRGKLTLFDVVLAAPPCARTDWGAQLGVDDPFGRFALGIPSNDNAVDAFVLHMLATLKPETGRMAVLVPYAVLTRDGSEGAIRKQLIDANVVDAVINLPTQLTGDPKRPTVVLIMRRNKSDACIYFINAANDAGDGTPESIVERIGHAYNARQRIFCYASLIHNTNIAACNYQLDFKFYVAMQ